MSENTKYVVVDLEMCNVPRRERNKFNFPNETIQIGAVIINNDFEVLDKFNTFVKPEYGKLDSFITELTGITSSDINNAPHFKDAFYSFMEWIPEKDVKMVSWSDADQIQIARELFEKKLFYKRYADFIPEWIDCQKLFTEKMHNNRCYRLQEALIMCGINTIGNFHDGLSDAHNTALLFKKIMTEPELKLSHYIIDEKDVNTYHMTYTLGDIFNNLNI